MKKTFVMSVIVMVFCLITLSYANDRDEFCAGFEEGYKAIKGNMVIVPICPIPPITPIGSTPYREGLKAGMKAARDGK
ncbi:hypothetical protein [Fibrobacter sp. UWB12]|uniref:hypothetical protein n=1 Tax=Fibrobacter sp. UWB12 TaxID=1896203 RepID=UPI00091004DC|nr:hypothetical protein [Fibrobacter sp. UWB12]SHK47810.1 hypothetical protein SAMN05720759_10316 [Fibrobacter sp. UWB12]